MRSDHLILLVAAVIGIAVGIQMQRRKPAGGPPVYTALGRASFYGNVPIASVPGPQGTWSLI